MVDNSNSGKTQMESSLGGSVYPQGGAAGVKLEAVMEHLQRQQQARLEMERKERRLRDARLMYAQQVAAQHAILAAARASAMGNSGKAQVHGVALERPDDIARGRDSGDDDEDVDADNDDEEEPMADEGSEEDEVDDGPVSGLEFLRKQTLALQQSAMARQFTGYAAASAPAARIQRDDVSPIRVKQEPEGDLSPADPQTAASPTEQADWGYDEHFKQNGNGVWGEESDSNRSRGEASRDFAKLYELDSDPNRKEFLDDLFTFMQKRGTPVNRIPIMAKQVLDLYMLYKLVTEKGGLVEVINKKIWREITKGLNLPTSITSAAFTLRTQYMKYLYPYECVRKSLSSPSELQAAIDSNRREGRRPSYSSSLFRFSSSPSSASHILSPPKMHLAAMGAGAAAALNGLQGASAHSLKALEDASSAMLAARGPAMALALGQQQVAGLARAATLEQLREKLETGTGLGASEGPERKMARLAEEQQRLMQQAFQHNLLAMASQMPMNLRMGLTPKDDKHDLALSISSTGSASISVSVEVNGVLYSGSLFAQKPASVPVSSAASASSVPPNTTFVFPSHSPSSSSSKAPSSAEPSTSGSP
ncbi:AT-rich interactive domain-containing protein 3B isoform X1 [Silurus asotus]|uniref:AT-rich interactive domain-containing protein 3 n=1 Tax=Silurus asotus TaxID=30991 RepID=A0AAD5A8Y3_SILAS|nr:AT-rich interactive domain-containing protein 3B isoform X1 [Silurus asotus]